MRVRREIRDGVALVILQLADNESQILRSLIEQYLDVIDADGGDPALERLFPAAYRDDPEAAAEFSTYTRSGLRSGKHRNAEEVLGALDDDPMRLDVAHVERWLRLLTDLRLVIAERLGIRADDDEIPDSPAGEIYVWLGHLQQLLLAAIDPEAA